MTTSLNGGNPEKIAEIVRRTREEQGLPPTIQDPTALALAASLLRPMLERAAKKEGGNA